MIAVSERVRRDVIDTLRLPPERVRLIYNGVEIERFQRARAEREAVRAEGGVAPGEVVFIFAARLVNQKRCCDFIEAFGRLQRREGGERLRAWILGDGPLRYELEGQAATLAHPDRVHFFGRRDDVERWLAGADVFVLPSTKEGFSNALVEALAAGLPAVASDVGGNAEAVRNGEEGLIVPPLAVDALTAAMGTMAFDDAWREARSRAAAARADAFSLGRMIAAVEGLYAES
jgi:glycosyltransferase involved in cell wall biosynthesis